MTKTGSYIIALFVLSLTATKSIAQQDTGNTLTVLKEYLQKATINELLDQKPPEFIGGRNAWLRYLKDSLNPFVPLKNNAIEGTYHVRIRFIIDHKGNIAKAEAETNAGYGMEKELIRVIKKSPQWKPALTKAGYATSYTTREEITFIVAGANSTVKIP